MVDRKRDISRYANEKLEEDSNDGNDSICPTFDDSYEFGRKNQIQQITVFYANEFNAFWNVISDKINKFYNIVAGLKCMYGVLIMVLAFSHGGKYDVLVRAFTLNDPTFEPLITKLIDGTRKQAYATYVSELGTNMKFVGLIKDVVQFQNHPTASYTTNVKFQ